MPFRIMIGLRLTAISDSLIPLIVILKRYEDVGHESGVHTTTAIP